MVKFVSVTYRTGSITFRNESARWLCVGSEKYEFFIKESGVINKDGTVTSGEVVKVDVKNYEEPTIDKKINGDLNNLPINTKTDYNYDIKTLIPEDIKDYKHYVVTDVLDSRLEIQDQPVVKLMVK